jgi:phosphatidylserine synthase
MKPASIGAYLFCFASTALLARYDLHTDDAGVEAFLILAVTFLLGCLHPRRAWQWALLVGATIPAVELLAAARVPELKKVWDVSLLTGFLIALGLAGSYAGAWVRRLATPWR